MQLTGEQRKNEIATRLTELHEEDLRLIIDRPLQFAQISWQEFLECRRANDEERQRLRKELFDLYSEGQQIARN